MHEHHIEVSRTARYYLLGAMSPAISQVWIACHGYAQLAGRFLRHFAPIADESRLIVAPEALSRFYAEAGADGSHAAAKVGATWMTREDRLAEINDYVAFLDAVHDAVYERIPRASTRLVALGFSQGVATAARWAVSGHARVDHLVLWGSLLPSDVEEGVKLERLRTIRLTMVVGERDQFARGDAADRQCASLHERGIPCELVRFDGGHHLDGGILSRLAGR